MKKIVLIALMTASLAACHDRDANNDDQALDNNSQSSIQPTVEPTTPVPPADVTVPVQPSVPEQNAIPNNNLSDSPANNPANNPNVPMDQNNMDNSVNHPMNPNNPADHSRPNPTQP